MERIRVVQEADRAYGALRVTAELNDGVSPEQRVNHQRVPRMVDERQMGGIRRRRRYGPPRPRPPRDPAAPCVTSTGLRSVARLSGWNGPAVRVQPSS